MGLARRIIPVILCRGRVLVKGERFNNWRSVGLAAQAVRIHAMRGVDEVMLLDITATKDGRGPDLALVAELSEVLFAPLAVGGGVRSVDDVRALLRAGADKVVIGTAAWMHDGLVRSIADTVGSQAVVVSVDVARGWVHIESGQVLCLARPEEWAAWMAKQGAGEILLQSVDRDGTMQGYDLDLISAVHGSVGIPVIASGGCGTYEHMRQALEVGASAVAAGAMFQFTDLTPRGAARYLARAGVEVRL